MFLVYWPVLAFVASLIILSIFIVLMMAEKICKVRNKALPERSLDSYLTDQELYDQDVNLASAAILPMDNQFSAPQYNTQNEPFDSYNLDYSLNAENNV